MWYVPTDRKTPDIFTPFTPLRFGSQKPDEKKNPMPFFFPDQPFYIFSQKDRLLDRLRY